YLTNIWTAGANGVPDNTGNIDFSNCTNLELLNLSQNYSTHGYYINTLNIEILNSLKEFAIWNRKTKAIVGFNAANNFDNLIYLNLAGNPDLNLQAPGWVEGAHFPVLKVLYMGQCSLSGSFDLSTFPLLQEINVKENQLTDLIFPDGSNGIDFKLTYLNLGYNDFTNPDQIVEYVYQHKCIPIAANAYNKVKFFFIAQNTPDISNNSKDLIDGSYGNYVGQIANYVPNNFGMPGSGTSATQPSPVTVQYSCSGSDNVLSATYPGVAPYTMAQAGWRQGRINADYRYY
ncbi:MAG: hypothetical protein AAFP02_14775, partial [Bacteroidota bacterium]